MSIQPGVNYSHACGLVTLIWRAQVEMHGRGTHLSQSWAHESSMLFHPVAQRPIRDAIKHTDSIGLCVAYITRRLFFPLPLSSMLRVRYPRGSEGEYSATYCRRFTEPADP